MIINQSTRKSSDKCYTQMRDIQSRKPVQFTSSGLEYAKNCDNPLSVFGMQNDTQYAPPHQNINTESELFNINKPSDIVDRKNAELGNIMFLTTGNLSSGPLLEPNSVSADLRYGTVPYREDSCRGQEEFRPTGYLMHDPQNPNTIIPEIADNMWITGGRSSRQDNYVLSKLGK